MRVFEQKSIQTLQTNILLRNACYNFTTIQDDEAVADLIHVRNAVGNVNARLSALLDLVHKVDHLRHFLERQCNCWLVKNDEIGLEIHRTSNGDPLALTT